MPSAKLLALAPATGQQLLLRSATASAASSSVGDRRDSVKNVKSAKTVESTKRDIRDRHAGRRTVSQLAVSRPAAYTGWCRYCASTLATATRSTLLTPRTASRVALFHTQTTRRTPTPIHAPVTAAPGVANFGTSTMPKQVAFPRHGKAVEPQLVPGEGAEAAAEEDEGAEDTKESTDSTDGQKLATPPPAAETSPTETKETKETKATEPATEKDASPAPAAAETAIPGLPSAIEQYEAIPTGPVSAEMDAQRESGRKPKDTTTSSNVTPVLDPDEHPSSTPTPAPTSHASVVAELAADAVAATATAAETARIAAEIINESVIELGPPGPAMKAIHGPGESQDKRPQVERVALPASLRQPLSQRQPPPHMVPPPYVHHFDSYSLVRQLELGGFAQAQSVTAMKAVRTLLATNLGLAQSNLVSKSDVENEAYLFKAACAELSIEVRNNRRRADEQMRQQRTVLQSEVDMAAQSVNQELVTLTDVVKGLFNDRKMAVREERKAMESAIQTLNYKITIMLNSEMRSEIEGLRWVLIRRSVLGIIFMAILTLGTLRYASYVSHEKKKQAERALREAREAEMQRYADNKIDSSSPPDAAEILSAS